MKTIPTSLAVIGMACISIQSYAANEQQRPIIVTATRTAETTDESLAAVTVITRKEIEQSGALSVAEVLRGVAGVDITNSGGFGKLTSVFMRGTSSTQVLVLVDGIEVGSVTAGQTSWEFLPVSEIERIEIVRGPRTTLYGSEAIGGVIQIFTRKGKGPTRPRVALGAGSHTTSEVSTGLSGGTGDNWFNLNLTRFRTEGIDAREPAIVFGAPLNEPDDDGYNNDAFSARFGHRFSNGNELEVHGLQADGNTEFDATVGNGNEDDFTQQVVGVKYRVRPTSRWNVLVEAGRSLDERRSFRDGSTAESQFNSEIRSFNWQNDLTFGSDHIVTIGTDFRDDRASGKFDPAINSPPDFKKRSRDDLGVFGQYQGNFDKHDILIGLREDDNEQFGHHTTGNIAWGYDIGKPTRLIASYGTAFRAPTFNDLFFPDFFGFPTSNPNLEPEKSKSLEVDLRGNHAYGTWNVRAYRTEIRDLIALDQNFIPQNINEATIEGFETEISATIGSWTGRAALSYVDPRDDETDDRLARRAKRTLKLDIERRFRNTQVILSVIAQSRHFDDQANTIEVDGYGIVNLAANHELSKNLRLSGRINNIFDKEYQTVDTFNELGRNIFVTIAYQPEL